MFNAYGQVFSIGELIASGYASFMSTGIGMSSLVNIVALFHPGPGKSSSSKHSFKTVLLFNSNRSEDTKNKHDNRWLRRRYSH